MSADVRAALAREAWRALGVEEAARLTGAWGCPPPPPFLAHARHGALPGVVRCLLENGALEATAPGVALLAWLVAGEPDGLRVAAAGAGERLDQIGWPCLRDARLALRAVDRLREVPVLLQGAVGAIRGFCAAGPSRGADLADAVSLAYGAWLLRSAGDAAAELIRQIRPSAAEVFRGLAARVRADPSLLGAEEKTFLAFVHLALAAEAAAQGWTAFHAHRGLPSLSAAEAAAAVVEASRLTRLPLAASVLTWAIELAVADEVPGQVSAGARRPRRVRIVGPGSEHVFAEGVAEILRARGCVVDERRVRVYPTGDAIVGFCAGALAGCDLLLLVCTAGEGSTWASGEVPVQLELMDPGARPQVILLRRGSKAAPRGLVTAVEVGGLTVEEATTALVGAVAGGLNPGESAA